MIYAITQFVRFDINKEKERLSKCFAGDKLERQLKIFNLFVDGDYKECYNYMVKLPYDDENECDEAEYVHPFIFENVRTVVENSHIRIEPINEHANAAKAKD